MHEADRLAWDLASKTGGAISRRAARDVGLCGELLGRRLRDGTWLLPTPRVLLLPGAPATFERDAWIGILDAGSDAALSHGTALSRWGLPGFTERPIHVARDRAHSAKAAPGVALHRTHLWPAHHRLLLDGMPVASPTRALFDLANEGGVHPKRLERAFNNAWGRGLTTGERLVRMAEEWCKRGRRGSAFIHDYLDQHPIEWQPPESNLEGRFRDLIVEAGMPEPIRQLDVGDEAAWIGRVDVRDPDLPVVGEIDSDLFHVAPLDAESDDERDRRLTAAGFEVVRFKEHEVWHDRNAVIERWRDARRRARCA